MDSDFRDKTHNDLRTGDVNVKIQAAAGATGGKAAYFDGKSKLTVWALNNMEFGSQFALTFRFKADGPTYRKDNRYDRNLPVALVDNSDCDRNATFGIALSSDGVSGTVFGGFLLEDSSIITRNVANIVSYRHVSLMFIPALHYIGLRVIILLDTIFLLNY